MKSEQGLRTTQEQGLFLTQQQLRFIRLLEMNAPELDDAVRLELEENPALEVKEEAAENERERFPLFHLNKSSDDTPAFAPADTAESIYENLERQIGERSLPPKVEFGARYIVASLDNNGYLSRPLDNLVSDMAINDGVELTPVEAREALDTVKSLEPAGVGAANLRECLELQLQSMPAATDRDDALRILREAYEPFSLKHKRRIVSMLKLTEQRVDMALALIRSLNPKPGAALSSNPIDESSVIIPDFVVTIDEQDINVILNNNIPELQIDVSFEQAMDNLERTAKGRPKKGSEFVVRNYNDARDYIRIISQRQQTMLAVMTAILKIQREYFLTEDVYRLRPMLLKDVAKLTGLDVSVISRATNNKFVQLPWGIYPLRFFFSDSIGENTEGDAATNRQIEAEIRSLVEAEDKNKPLSDQRIMEEMVARGYDLKRRTVAKYRDRLGIPVARLRKIL